MSRPDPIAIAEQLAQRRPNMRLEKALVEIKHEMRREAVLEDLRGPAPVLVPASPSAVARVAANLRAIADKLEGKS